MSAEPAIPKNEEPPQLTVLETSDPAALISKKPRPHDKIARLPKVLRDQVNAMLDDGIPYNLIVTRLQQSTDPPLPYPISEMNISRWKDGGYQRHLARQERFAYVNENREAALEMAAADTTTLPEGALQIIASHYYDILSDFSPASVKEKLAEDPLKYTRFLNVFARLTREIVNLKKHRDQGAKTASAELKPPDKSRPWNDIEREGFLDRADDLFNLKSAARLKREAAAGSAGILAGLAVSPVEDQNSEIENVDETSPSPPLEERAGLSSEVVLTKEEERRPAEILPGIENPNSKIKNPERPCKILPRRKNENSQIRNADSARTQNSQNENGKKESEGALAPSESVPPKIGNAAVPTREIEMQNSETENLDLPIKNTEEVFPSHPPCSAEAAPRRVDERAGLSSEVLLTKEKERRLAEISPAIKNQKSQIENADAASLPSSGGEGQGEEAVAPIKNSKIQTPEVCHSCRTALPPLLPDGERPFALCQRCGTALHSPHNRHLYCPACASDLRMIIFNGQRTLSTCPCCDAQLPPWPPPT